ncbi:MAG: 50S ribosomal protein L6 [Chloroflexi bacterium]|uniref:Large ribosomal subunit protein uL6 n=1 Tax=Candidatus Chlorohelix allophototropha TaxID=3003348 RepID=A0A8T7LZ49_9CHLR|nr:50S ribosomal protein L6 [Chloroflexota bacterium]WJW65641.1 50S ribosomal protein L6 [Chloroflexota bacterium L227-S17]
MSRIGRKPITLPKGVEVKIEEGNLVHVKGPKGELSRQLDPTIVFERNDATIEVKRPDDSNRSRAMHGLTRTLLDNMIVGVSAGYRRDLEIAGVGYRAVKDGNDLVLLLGFSHATKLQPPEGITYVVESATKVSVQGIDKEIVGAQAARIRALRPPEPYKGKGIRLAGEVIRRKAGKAGKAGKK